MTGDICVWPLHIFQFSALSFAIQSKNNCIKLCATEREISFLVATFALSTVSSVVGGIACYTCLPARSSSSISLSLWAAAARPFRSLSLSICLSCPLLQQIQTSYDRRRIVCWLHVDDDSQATLVVCVCVCANVSVCACECMMSWWISWLAWLTLSLSLATWRCVLGFPQCPDSECLNYWSNRRSLSLPLYLSPYPSLSNARQRVALAVLSCLPNYLRNYEHVSRSATAASQGQQSGDVVRLVVVVASEKLILKHISLSSLSMRPSHLSSPTLGLFKWL